MEIEYKIGNIFREFAKDIEGQCDTELQETLFLLGKIRADLELGRYDTDIKKWSETSWR